MNKTSLQNSLKSKILGQEIFFFEETDSTNEQAKKIATQKGVRQGSIIVAAQQTQGRGTDGNVWESGKNNLFFSIIFDNRTNNITTLFPFYPAVAIAKTLKNKYNINAHVKWPNDVLVGSKKIAGILCEGVAHQYMTVGIGLNVNATTFPDSVKDKAISMKLINENNFLLEDVLQNILSEYEHLLFDQCNIRQEWLNHTQMIGKQITAIQDGISQKIKVLDISEEGFLIIKKQGGKIENWMARRGMDLIMSNK